MIYLPNRLTWQYLDNRSIHFSWEPPEQQDAVMVHIIPVQNSPTGEKMLDRQHWKRHDLRNLQGSPTNCTFQLPAHEVGRVTRRDFCVFASGGDTPVESDVQLLQQGIICRIAIGKAKIECRIRERKLRDSVKEVQILLNCSSEIDRDILGYRYDFLHTAYTYSFPGTLSKGSTLCPPIYLPHSSLLRIIPRDQQYAGNLEILMKKWRWPHGLLPH